MDRNELEALVSRIPGGDAGAEQALFAGLRRRLRALALARGVRDHDADDIVQDVMAAVLGQLRQGRFKFDSHPSTWITQILLNKTVDYRRKRDRTNAHHDSNISDHAEHLSVRSCSPELRLQVLRALARLTPSERFVLTATELGGLTYEEVAVKMRCPTGTVASTKHRAMARFRQFLTGPDLRPLKAHTDAV